MTVVLKKSKRSCGKPASPSMYVQPMLLARFMIYAGLRCSAPCVAMGLLHESMPAGEGERKTRSSSGSGSGA